MQQKKWEVRHNNNSGRGVYLKKDFEEIKVGTIVFEDQAFGWAFRTLCPHCGKHHESQHFYKSSYAPSICEAYDKCITPLSNICDIDESFLSLVYLLFLRLNEKLMRGDDVSNVMSLETHWKSFDSTLVFEMKKAIHHFLLYIDQNGVTTHSFFKTKKGWQHIFGIILVNAHHVVDKGDALFPIASLVNHNCQPNCTYRAMATLEKGVILQLIAIRPIAAGEEITISYIDIGQPRRHRLKALFYEKHFVCTCVLCESSSIDVREGIQQNLPCCGQTTVVPHYKDPSKKSRQEEWQCASCLSSLKQGPSQSSTIAQWVSQCKRAFYCMNDEFMQHSLKSFIETHYTTLSLHSHHYLHKLLYDCILKQPLLVEKTKLDDILKKQDELYTTYYGLYHPNRIHLLYTQLNLCQQFNLSTYDIKQQLSKIPTIFLDQAEKK